MEIFSLLAAPLIEWIAQEEHFLGKEWAEHLYTHLHASEPRSWFREKTREREWAK